MPRKATYAGLALGAALAAAAGPLTAAEPRLVHQQLSVYRNIQVIDTGPLRCMLFGRRKSRQTCIDLQQPDLLVQPYTQAMFAGYLVQPRPHRVLVIGLGGGVIPMAMRKLDPDVHIDSVELDPAVIEVAGDYFGFRPDARSHAHADDGRMFVRRRLRAGDRYDMILLDAYDANYIPEHLLTVEFMRQLHGLLTPDGVLVANTFANRPLQPYENATYQAAFGSTWSLTSRSRGNRIIVAPRAAMPTAQARQDNAALLHGRVERFGFSMRELLAGLRKDAAETRVKPLTDQHSPANLLLQY